VLGWPFLLFSAAVLVAVLRGNDLYGLDLVGQPTRLILYAGIAFAVVRINARQAYKGVVVVFYVGTVWMMLNAAYHLATGTSQTTADSLSTGGTRILSYSVSMYLGAALFLALINLHFAHSAKARLLHATFAGLATFGVILGFFRGVFLAVLVVLPFLFAVRAVRRSLLGVLPIVLPVAAILTFGIGKAVPELGTTLQDRVLTSQTEEANYLWRKNARAAIWEQVHRSPVIGVGFGKDETFTVRVANRAGLLISKQQAIGQQAHNSFLWMLAGGGIPVLGGWLLLLLISVYDSWRRFRGAVDDHERALIAWCVLSLLSFSVVALSEPVFAVSPILIGTWSLILLPTVVPLRDRRRPAEARAA
jgi:hypothetical protein